MGVDRFDVPASAIGLSHGLGGHSIGRKIGDDLQKTCRRRGSVGVEFHGDQPTFQLSVKRVAHEDPLFEHDLRVRAATALSRTDRFNLVDLVVDRLDGNRYRLAQQAATSIDGRRHAADH